jgi:hypothetical protein
MQVIKIVRIPMFLFAFQACLDSGDPVTSAHEQDERIEVHGCRPGLLQVGEECVDPRGGGPGGGGGSGGERDPRGPGGGGGGGGGGCMGAGCGGEQATRWTCDARCNVEEDEPGASCPNRVTGRGTGTSSRQACLAAQRDANSKVPRGCHKRHCHCDCSKGRDTASYDDDFITASTHE